MQFDLSQGGQLTVSSSGKDSSQPVVSVASSGQLCDADFVLKLVILAAHRKQQRTRQSDGQAVVEQPGLEALVGDPVGHKLLQAVEEAVATHQWGPVIQCLGVTTESAVAALGTAAAIALNDALNSSVRRAWAMYWAKVGMTRTGLKCIPFQNFCCCSGIRDQLGYTTFGLFRSTYMSAQVSAGRWP